MVIERGAQQQDGADNRSELHTGLVPYAPATAERRQSAVVHPGAVPITSTAPYQVADRWIEA
jgi:hypothetical protein